MVLEALEARAITTLVTLGAVAQGLREGLVVMQEGQRALEAQQRRTGQPLAVVEAVETKMAVQEVRGLTG